MTIKAACALLSLLVAGTAALNPKCKPGGNFDLSKWKLQLPIGRPGSPTTISSSALVGCTNGYQDPQRKYFYTEPHDGSLVMRTPGGPDNTGCVTTAHSKHCRTELRESSPSSWDPKASKNRLKATLTMIPPKGASGNVCVGQIHILDSISTKPVAELYYHSNGDLALGVEQTRAGGNQVVTPVGHVAPGTRFTYEIRYEGGKLSLSLNGNPFRTFSTYKLASPRSYFKAGNYNQADSPSDVHFYALSVQH